MSSPFKGILCAVCSLRPCPRCQCAFLLVVSRESPLLWSAPAILHTSKSECATVFCGKPDRDEESSNEFCEGCGVKEC